MGKASYEALMRLAFESAMTGNRQTSGAYYRDVAGRCEEPVFLEMSARPDLIERPKWRFGYERFGHWELLPDTYVPQPEDWDATQKLVREVEHPRGHVWVQLHVPCRKCRVCLLQRARLWTARAIAETKAASRTWFCTFTLTPDEQYKAYLRAVTRDGGHQSFDTRTGMDQFLRRCNAISPEVTRYVKRVRKESNAPLRYLFVTERHKSGDPHFHALVHEKDPARPLRKAVLRGQWGLGFTQVKLCDPNTAGYLCKYLAKDVATRVRSSLRYGVDTVFNHSQPEADVRGDQKEKKEFCRHGELSSELPQRTSRF